jgi:hypothetical protein
MLSLTFLDEPAANKPVMLSVEEVHGGDVVLIVIESSISSEYFIGSDLHIAENVRGIDWLLVAIFDNNSWEVLISPWAPVGISIFVVFAFEEFFALLFIIANIYKYRKII